MTTDYTGKSKVCTSWKQCWLGLYARSAHLEFVPDSGSACPLLRAPGMHAMILLLRVHLQCSRQTCRQQQALMCNMHSDVMSE